MDLPVEPEQGQRGLVPMVFFCSSCRTILSDSKQFVSSHREEQVISVRGTHAHSLFKSPGTFYLHFTNSNFLRYRMGSLQEFVESMLFKARIAAQGEIRT